MGDGLSDIRWSLRLIRRRPAFASAVVLTLAFGVAVTITAVGLATAVLWRPLPFPQAERLVFAWENGARAGAADPSRVTAARFDDWQRSARSFASMSAFGAVSFMAHGSDGATNLRGVRVSTTYFDTLGVAPLVGRRFEPSDGVPGQDRVVILSHALWLEWFGGRADVLDRTLRLNGQPYRVIGVMPAVVFPAWPVNPAVVTLDSDACRFWIPIAWTPELAASARAHVLGVVARLGPGVSPERAAGELAGLSEPTDPDRHGAVVRPFRDQFVRDAQAPLLALLGAALAVLLVAFTNLAALQGSAVESRRGELAVRAALGAGRDRIARLLATEAAMFVLAGTVIGIGLAHAALAQVPRLLPPSFPLLTPPAIDLRVVACAGGLSLIAVASLAAWPMARARALSAPAPRGATSAGRSLVFRALVVIQVAFAMALVACAALLQQSLGAVRRQDTGFVVDRVLVTSVSFAGPAYADPRRLVTAERRLAAELARVPGARAISLAYDHPLEANWMDAFTLVGSAAAADDIRGSAELRLVSPSYFDTLGVELLDGRVLAETDDLDALGAVVVNEAFARRFDSGPLLDRVVRSSSARMAWSDPGVPDEFRIVGIVEDERFKGLELPSQPAVYMSTRQFPQRDLVLLVRTGGEPSRVTPSIRAAVRAFDATMPVGRITSLSAILGEQLVARRVTTQVISGFAGAGLALASLGLYGMLALLVSGRMRETGIRLALGSPPAHEAGRVLREGVTSTAAGVACGIALALLAGRLVQNLLVDVSPADTVTLAGVSLAMLAVAGGAASIPAWRAARVDPARILQGD